MSKQPSIPPKPPDRLKIIKLDLGPSKTRSRPDRAAKCLLKHTHQETVVKSSLLKYLQGNKQAVKEAIKVRVKAFSQRINLASLALVGILKDLFDGVNDLENVSIPFVVDQTFFRQLLLGTKHAHQPIQLIRDYENLHPELFQDIERHLGLRNIYSAGAIKYITNLKNAMFMNFLPRVKAFTKRFQLIEDLSDTERVSLLYVIMGWNTTSLSIGCMFPMRESVNEVVKQHRMVLGFGDPCKEISEEWIKDESSIPFILKYYVTLNRYYEANDQKLFNLVPVCRFKSHFITIDTSSLYGIMKELKLVDCNEQTFQSMRNEHWNSFIKIERLQGRDNLFTGTIETDGVSICTHFQRPKKERKEDKLQEPYKYDRTTERVIGVDPGRTNIFYGAEVLENGEIKKHILSRKQYYTNTGTLKARKKSESWQKEIKTELVDLSKVSTKGTSVEKHHEYLTTYFKHYTALWSEYTKERWARQTLRLYGGKQKVYDKFFNQIKGKSEKKIVIAYGSSKFAPGGLGEMSVPTTKIFKETKKRFKTLLVDEFRTTKVCLANDSILQRVLRKGNPSSDVRGLLWCGSTNNKFYVNRDLNAALNIQRCLTSQIRPASLTRQPGQGRLQTVIGRVTKW